MEEECKKSGFSGLLLDVYDKSDHAIKFYEKKGFKTIGTAPYVYVMEKKL